MGEHPLALLLPQAPEQPLAAHQHQGTLRFGRQGRLHQAAAMGVGPAVAADRLRGWSGQIDLQFAPGQGVAEGTDQLADQGIGVGAMESGQGFGQGGGQRWSPGRGRGAGGGHGSVPPRAASRARIRPRGGRSTSIPGTFPGRARAPSGPGVPRRKT